MHATAPRRPARTYHQDGHEVYVDTGRPVDEELGSHVVLWIVDDSEAWAKAIEAEGDAQVAQWSKSTRHVGEHRREQAYVSAAEVRADGPGRRIYSHYRTEQAATATAADLRRAHPNPGVRYEVAAIEAASACHACHQPTILADGQWRHHLGRYPTECTPEPVPEPERQSGEFEISPAMGCMTCGYCDHIKSWPEAAVGYVKLTGFHLLGIERATGVLVVLAEAADSADRIHYLPHHCESIPEELHIQYAADRLDAATSGV